MSSFSKKDEMNLAIDIGTRTVKAVLFKKENKGIKILNYGKVDYPFEKNSKKNDLKQTIKETISEVRGFKRGRKIIVGLGEISGPNKMIMTKGITKKYIFQRKSPLKKISQKEFKKIITVAQERSKRSVAKNFSLKKAKNLKILKASIEEIKINGHQVSNPLGFSGKELKFSIFNSYILKEDLEFLKRIFKSLNLNLVNVLYEPYTLFSLLESFHSFQNHNAAFLDIGGDFTQVSFIKKGMLMETKPFSIGGQEFSAHLAKWAKIKEEKAEKIKIAYSRGLIQSSLAFKIHNLLEKDFKNWLEKVEIILNRFFPSDSFPSFVYILGGGSQLLEVKSLLYESKEMDKIWKKKNFLPPKIEFLKPKHFINIEDNSKLQDTQGIIPLSLCKEFSLNFQAGNAQKI